MARQHDGIFGTPPEPLFNDIAASLQDDGLSDCLNVLKEQNNLSIKTGLKLNDMGHFKNGDNAHFMFLICDYFGMVEHAKYLSVEIYDQFMARHVCQLFDHVQKSHSKTKMKEWKIVMNKVRSQCYLRMLSAVQLASKLTSHYKVLSVKKVWNVLNMLGQHYTTESITKSEIRILKVLNFDVMFLHPLVHVETLLEVMSRRYTSLDIKLFYITSMHLLDLAYFRRTFMYKMLYTVVTGKPMLTKEDRCQFRVVMLDNLLLAVAVLAATAYILDPLISYKIVELLVKKTDIPLEDMMDFATVLVQLIHNETES